MQTWLTNQLHFGTALKMILAKIISGIFNGTFSIQIFDLGINKKKLDNYDIGKKIPNDGKLKINHQIYDKIQI